MKYTIEDVAKKAGVSITTVSRVINGNYPVKAETKKRVEEVIKEYSYQPNPLARGLISNKSYYIGVVVPGITNMFFTQVLHGIEKYAKALGYEVFFNDSEGDPAAERNSIGKLVGRLVDAIIVIDPQTENMKSGFFEEISAKTPLICVNGYNKDMKVNFIMSNEEKGTKEALDYLLSLGHSKIAFVRGENSYSYDLKEAIYLEYMARLNENPMIINTKDGNSTDVVDNVSRRISEIQNKEYKIGSDITAFFACNDLMAVGIMNGCSAAGINVPEDISVIGFDNIIISEMIRPKLTTVDQNMRKLGDHAAKAAIDLIESKELRCGFELIDTKLVIRDSCMKLKLSSVSV
ncbi:MAG: LacI family DNA-binding transcriptional regulator [Bacillota bacterium]